MSTISNDSDKSKYWTKKKLCALFVKKKKHASNSVWKSAKIFKIKWSLPSSKQTMNTIISIKGNLFLYYTGIVNGWTDGMIIIRGLSILCGALINQVLIRK
jgi:hypothetical protein